jgi:hypothetical protein
VKWYRKWKVGSNSWRFPSILHPWNDSMY